MMKKKLFTQIFFNVIAFLINALTLTFDHQSQTVKTGGKNSSIAISDFEYIDPTPQQELEFRLGLK